MSKVQERGLAEMLNEAEGLANVLRIASGGRIDLAPMLRNAARPVFDHPVSWGEARTEATALALTHQGGTICPACGQHHTAASAARLNGQS